MLAPGEYFISTHDVSGDVLAQYKSLRSDKRYVAITVRDDSVSLVLVHSMIGRETAKPITKEQLDYLLFIERLNQ